MKMRDLFWDIGVPIVMGLVAAALVIWLIPQSDAKGLDAATYIPKNAQSPTGLPLLHKTVDEKWTNKPLFYPQLLAAQIEQETCVSLTGSKCWTSKAELKTDRELGSSYGQFTIAYNQDGTVRFNAFDDVKKLDKDLADWTFEKRQDPQYGMLALVVRDKSEFYRITGAKDDFNRACFAFSTYNGGSLLADRRLCRATKGCDPSQWFDHVEKTSYKQKVVQKGYGQSWYDINRNYVKAVMYTRSAKYESYFKD